MVIFNGYVKSPEGISKICRSEASASLISHIFGEPSNSVQQAPDRDECILKLQLDPKTICHEQRCETEHYLHTSSKTWMALGLDVIHRQTKWTPWKQMHTLTWWTNALSAWEANYNFEQFSEKLEPMRHILGWQLLSQHDHHRIWIARVPVEPGGPTSP